MKTHPYCHDLHKTFILNTLNITNIIILTLPIMVTSLFLKETYLVNLSPDSSKKRFGSFGSLSEAFSVKSDEESPTVIPTNNTLNQKQKHKITLQDTDIINTPEDNINSQTNLDTHQTTDNTLSPSSSMAFTQITTIPPNAIEDLEAANNNITINNNNLAETITDQPTFEFIVPDNVNDDIMAQPSREGSIASENEMITSEEMQKMEQAWTDLSVMFLESSDDPDGENTKLPREFLTAMEIAPRSKLARSSAEQLGLNKLPGVFLVSIERPSHQQHHEPSQSRPHSQPLPVDTNDHNSSLSLGESTSLHTAKDNMDDNSSFATARDPNMIPVLYTDPLLEGDVLWFSGSATAIGDLRKIPGLKSYVNDEVKKINEKVHDRRLVQAVIARRSKLVGKTVREAQFRTRFGAAVISVHREAKRVQEHPGKIRLQAGDVLLLEAGPTFIKKSANGDDSFALLAEVEDSAPPRLKLLIPALGLSVAMLAVFTAGVAPLLVCGLITSMLMVMFGILSQQEVRDAINWEVYVTIACAFGIGTALTNSGIASGIAKALVALGKAVNIGDAGLFAAVYFATFLISNVVTNNAAAALLFPIAMDAAEETGADRKLMAYILMLGASASFMSPFGYTTNLLIYGPGGYKYNDFLRIGTPMQLLLWILSVILVSATGNSWYLTWAISFGVFLTVSLALTINNPMKSFLHIITRKKHLLESEEVERYEH
mmetsp:Transcript_14471/g.20628  ORF Transcript_14471/g.20628 Transcript_14471/m.20628 type:complete len:715 (-) Transcript_14471:17-2161(-)